MRVDAHIEMLKAYVGHEIGLSPWTLIDQERIDAHARNSGDDLWIHTDPSAPQPKRPSAAPSPRTSCCCHC